ncbi:putative Flagellar M-ring protein [Nitrospina gracilis 3/211]|uniref:Flagellar M-ring protein n=1 Tax=Nitrospina gracilis (strain 3/211) TaxID=1266370 RepID=M1YJ66_NITG3|nr:MULTISPECIES: flagellar basal-body MS-ring/collar protein FliF [Nitrospina]MCF8723483.1 flagellar M-ring protein FliF [Nitrospina sp. Nb-3]CCQ90550.1 putative Flagellar M-ring protein [Nitrospina gracilis 3/211]
MEAFLEFLTNLGRRFNELPAVQKVAALGLLAGMGAAVVAMLFWAQAPDYQLLYANLSEKDAAAVVEELKTQNIPYELSNQGRNIRIPSNRVHEVRLDLASQGLPTGTEVGLELFEDTPLGMTEFVQKLNFQRALQGELVRTITSLSAVEHARVHLVLPKTDVFSKEKPRGKASVMVKLNAGQTLSETQVQGIVHLVSASVEGLQVGDVVVVDLQGNMLSGGKEVSEAALLTASNYKHKRRVEKELESSIVSMLEDALGPGRVIAKVAAEINFDKVERTEEIFDPDSQVIRSEQNTTEQVIGAAPPGGLAGVQSLTPGTGNQQATGTGSKRNNEKSTLNYEINKVVKHVQETTGEIQKLSVSVMVDGKMVGDPPEYQARSQEEMAKLLQLVRTAVGYDEVRGDQIQLENVQFDKSTRFLQSEEVVSAQKFELALKIAEYVIGAILLVLLVMRVLLPMVRWITTSVEVVEEIDEGPTPEEIQKQEEEKRMAQMAQENIEMRKSVEELVGRDPRYAASVIRKWMRERSAGA